jgi:hypothetical protein
MTNVLGAAYLVAIMAAVMALVGTTKFVGAGDGTLQIVALKFLAAALIACFASLACLYLAYWRQVGRPWLLRWVLKFAVFPWVLCQAAVSLGQPGGSSLGVTALLFVLLTDPFRLLERGAVTGAALWARRRALSEQVAPTPKTSSDLYGADVFALLIPLLFVLPRILGR